MLAKPDWEFFAALSGGTLGGTLCALLQLQEVPRIAAWIGSAALLLTSLILASTRANFTPREMREEALLGIAISGSLIAAVPAMAAGWQSALALNIGEKSGTNLAIPTWVLVLGTVAAAAGVLRSLFRRHQ
jgi:hypothetical protein